LRSDLFSDQPICPPDNHSFFKSQERYMQGLPPYSHEPLGDLTNTYVCEIRLSYISNPFPFPIAITIMHGEIPIGDMRVAYGSTGKYHAILPPKKDIVYEQGKQIYRTNENVNSKFAQLFPNLIADPKKIRKGVFARNKQNVTIPLMHPITHWLYKQCAFYKGMPLPTPIQEVGKPLTSVEVSAGACSFAVASLVEMINDLTPIIDLMKLRIKYTALDTQLFNKNTEILCHRIETTGDLASQKILDPKGVSIGLCIMYMFKDQYGTKYEDEETDDEDEDEEFMDAAVD